MEINKNFINRLNNINTNKNLSVAKLIDELKTENQSTASKDFSPLKNLEDILLSLNGKSEVTPQTLTLANNLLLNELPITKENLQVLSQAIKIFEDNQIEKGVFLLKNDLKPTQNIINQVNMHVSKEKQIETQISDFLKTISNLENSEEILKVLTSEEISEEFKNIKTELKTFKNNELNINLSKEINTQETFENSKALLPEDFHKTQQDINPNFNNKISDEVKTDFIDKTSKDISLDFSKESQSTNPNFNTTQTKDKNFSALPNKEYPETNLKQEEFLTKLTSAEILLDSSNFLNKFTALLKDTKKIEDLIKEIEIQIQEETKLQEKALNTQIKETNPPEDIKTKEEIELKKSIPYKKETIPETKKDFPQKNIITKFKNEKHQLKEFLQTVKQNKTFQKETIQLFTKINTLNTKIKESLTFSVKNSTPEDLNEFFDEFLVKLNTLKPTLENSEKALTSLKTLENNINFLNQVKNNIYIQIPLNINNETKTAELYVFKDKKNKTASKGKNGSALISLELTNLGLVETFVNKTEDKIALQFRLKNDFTENLIKQNLDLLEKYLSSKKLTLSNVQFKKTSEKFSIISTIEKTSNPINIASFNKQA